MKKIINILSSVAIVGITLMPSLSYAVGVGDTPVTPKETPPTSSINLKNPLGEANSDPRVIVGNAIKLVLGLIGSLSLLIFMYGGLTWMTSGGNSDKVKSGRDTLMWATIGLLVIFSSYTLVTYVITKIAQQ